MSREEALHNVDLAEVLDIQWAYYERRTGKSANWDGAGILDRVAEILKEKAECTGA